MADFPKPPTADEIAEEIRNMLRNRGASPEAALRALRVIRRELEEEAEAAK